MKKLNNPKFLILFFYNIFISVCIYFFQFYLFKGNVDYFICTDIDEFVISVLSFEINLIYPYSCDLEAYVYGIENFPKLFTLENYVYVNRPLFILYMYFIYSILKILLSSLLLSNVLIIQISFYFAQIILSTIITMLICNLLNLKNIDIGSNFYYFPIIILLSPVFKWHLFESTSMTFTLLLMVYAVYLISLQPQKLRWFHFFFAGSLYLVHRSAVLIIVFYLLNNFLSKQMLKKKIQNTFIFSIPIIIFYSLLNLFSVYSDHQGADYRQFVWIFDYLQGLSTKSSGYFCQTPLTAIKCYLKDFSKLVYYLFTPILVLLFYFSINMRNISSDSNNLIIYFFLYSMLTNLFWLFVGWYPPIRFSYYGLGNLVIICSLLIFITGLDKFSKNLFVIAYVLYFLLLNHWNYSKIIIYTPYIYTSIFIFLMFLYQTSINLFKESKHETN